MRHEFSRKYLTNPRDFDWWLKANDVLVGARGCRHPERWRWQPSIREWIKPARTFECRSRCRAVRTESLLNDLAAKQNALQAARNRGIWPDSGSQTAKFEPSGRCFSELTSSVA